jgi:hypothetical protein
MEKKSNKYHLKLQLSSYANGDTTPAKEMEMDFDNHDEIFSIIERLTEKNPFNDPAQAAQFALGLKLFGEVKLKNRNHPLFEEMNSIFPAFMKKLKNL